MSKQSFNFCNGIPAREVELFLTPPEGLSVSITLVPILTMVKLQGSRHVSYHPFLICLRAYISALSQTMSVGFSLYHTLSLGKA